MDEFVLTCINVPETKSICFQDDDWVTLIHQQGGEMCEHFGHKLPFLFTITDLSEPDGDGCRFEYDISEGGQPLVTRVFS